LILSSSKFVFALEDIRLTIGHWPPLMSEDRPHYGIITHITSAAFAEVGIQVNYDFFPWKRSFEVARIGRWHGTLPWGRTEEREENFHYSNIIHTEEVLFYLKEKPLVWDKVEDLQGMDIGLELGSAKSPMLEDAEKRGIVRYVKAVKKITAYHQLLKKRFDLFGDNKVVGTYLIANELTPEQGSRITYSPKSVANWDYHLILTKAVKENKRYISLFNEGFQILKKSGKYDQMWQDFYRGKYDVR